MVNVALRSRLIALGCAIGAVWFAWLLANGSYALPAMAAAIAVLGTATVLLRASFSAIVIGIVLFGYIVGNRGFAQLMPITWLPLLPAEFALLAAGGWMLVQCAFAQQLPFRRDALNAAILVWLVVGTVRVVFDIPVFGAMALRDYAMVYYAGFFFLGQHVAAETNSREFLRRVLIWASVAQPIAVVLSEAFPDFFLGKLVIRGIPVIYFKGDLALTFMAGSALFLALATPRSQRWWTWPLATAEMLYVFGGANRASVLGAIAALALLAFSRARRFVALQGAVLAVALVILLGAAVHGGNRWAEAKVAGLTERAGSLFDVFGRKTYSSDESSMKGDNNRFRSVWWQVVAAETIAENPVFGLGFGHDLSRNFLQEYNPEMAEDFTARSPHSILVSALGRMGFVGLVVFASIAGILARRTWSAIRAPDTSLFTVSLWGCIWIIWVSACFGVVLEGPMGAVVFWTAMGIACIRESTPEPEVSVSPSAPRLRAAAPADEVTPAS